MVFPDHFTLVSWEVFRNSLNIVLLSLDLIQAFRVVFVESVVFEFMESVEIFDFVEVVHVELSHERGIVFGFEIFGQDFNKLLGVAD